MSVRKKFRQLLARPGLTVMPGAYDALSARIIEKEGFEAIVAGGYSAVGTLLGEPDGGQSNLRDYADHYARISGAVSIPVYVDGDTGFGGVHNVRQMVRAFEAAGVAGLFFSDQTFPNRCGYLPGKQVVPIEEMLAKLAAALDARRDPDLFICARTDVRAVEGADATVERCQLFMEAGADMAKPHGFDSITDIQRILDEVKGPHLATHSQAAGKQHVTFAELEAIGVAGVTLPSLSLFAAARAVRDVARTVRRRNALAPVADALIPLADYYELVGLEAHNAREQRYDEAAAALLGRKPAAAHERTRAGPAPRRQAAAVRSGKAVRRR